MANYSIARFDGIDPVACPCGFSRRAFADVADSPATMHVTEITEDAQTHYHKKLTEIYFVLEGEGEMELDGERVPLAPMTAVLVKPGCRHRAVGRFKVAIAVVPPFDPEDEWFD